MTVDYKRVKVKNKPINDFKAPMLSNNCIHKPLLNFNHKVDKTKKKKKKKYAC